MNKRSKINILVITTFAVILTVAISISSFSAGNTNTNEIKDKEVREALLSQEMQAYQKDVYDKAYNEAIQNPQVEETFSAEENAKIEEIKTQADERSDFYKQNGDLTASIVNRVLGTSFTYETIDAKDKEILDNGGLVYHEAGTTEVVGKDLMQGAVNAINSGQLTADEINTLKIYLDNKVCALNSNDQLRTDIYNIFGVEPPASNECE